MSFFNSLVKKFVFVIILLYICNIKYNKNDWIICNKGTNRLPIKQGFNSSSENEGEKGKQEPQQLC